MSKFSFNAADRSFSLQLDSEGRQPERSSGLEACGVLAPVLSLRAAVTGETLLLQWQANIGEYVIGFYIEHFGHPVPAHWRPIGFVLAPYSCDVATMLSFSIGDPYGLLRKGRFRLRQIDGYGNNTYSAACTLQTFAPEIGIPG